MKETCQCCGMEKHSLAVQSVKMQIFILLAISFVGCSLQSTPSATPNIEATVVARVLAILETTPTPPPGPMFTPSEAVSVVQQYLRTKTYVRYGSPFGPSIIQPREVRHCDVKASAEWQAIYKRDSWIITRTIVRGSSLAEAMDEWSLDEPTRLVSKLVPKDNSILSWNMQCYQVLTL